ncbi:MAG: hypothetical protein ACPGVU_19595 [Limisphaerales bacterium]
MNLKRITLLAALLISTLVARAQFEPLGVISVKNYDSMMDAAVRVQKALEQTEPDLRKEFLREAGNPEGTGIDMKRPWHFVFSPPMPPQTSGVTAFFVPVTNFKEFKGALQGDSMFKGRGNKNVIRKSGNYAVIVQRSAAQSELDAELVKSVAAYRKQLPTKTAKTYRLHIRLNDKIRAMLNGGLMMIRNLSNAQVQQAPNGAPNPLAALGPIMDIYYNVGEMLVKGLSELQIDAEVTDDELRFFERVTAIAGSDLEKLMAPSKAKISHLASHLDGDATIAFVGHIQGSEFLSDLTAQAMSVGIKMQGGDQNEEVMKKIESMVGRMLPMTFAASIEMEPGMKMSGIYQFPKANAKQMKKDMAEFIDFSTKAQVGKNGLYSTFERKEGVRKVKGVSVDRVTANINTDAAMLKIPGQLEAFRVMWPDDKITYESATKGKQVFYSMGAPIEKAMVPSKSPMKLRVKVDDNAFVAGRYNLLKLMTQWLPLQKGVPAAMGEIAKKLDSTGTGVDMKASLDGGFSAELVVPLKLLTQFSHFGKEMAKSRPGRATAEPKAP